MAHRLTPRGARRRQQLMDTAAHAFAVEGYHSTSVASIVDRLGVGKGVFYWYFASKDDLMITVLEEAVRDLRLAQRDAIAGEHDPARRIEQGIRATLTWLSDHRHLFVLMESARTEERFSAILRHADNQAVADALPHVSAGVTAGLLRREDPEVLTTAIFGVTLHLARVLVLERKEAPDHVAESAIAFCREGYQASPAAVPRRIA